MKKILLSLILFIGVVSGCGNTENKTEIPNIRERIEIEESEIAEVNEKNKQSTVGIGTTNLSEKLYKDEVNKVYNFVQGNKKYQLKLYYREDNSDILVSHASVLNAGNVIQEINFETYNAKEQKLKNIDKIGTYEAPLKVYSLSEMIKVADYNYDGYDDFEIDQELYNVNSSAFLFLWNDSNSCFDFEMRNLYTTSFFDKNEKQVVFNIEGGIYPQKRYYGIDEKGKLYLRCIEWGTWQNEDLGLEYSKWFFVETEESVKADELKSNEKMWGNSILTKWETEMESILSEWNTLNAMDTVYFTIYNDGQIIIASTKEEL